MSKLDKATLKSLFGQFPFPQVVPVKEDLEAITSRDDLFRVVQSIRFCGLLKQLNLRVNTGNCGTQVFVSFSCPTLERDSSQLVTDCQAAVAYVRLPTTSRELLKELRNRLIFFIVHEVDEGILLGTNRIFDPHDPDKAIRDQQR